ncbi:hypothetical protein KQX54_008312 [Cotesia glomerata]|uniref:Uncharacterized protein n=1 Tax=Cotesia glomerata TaxID=32391 RepID=A0AAV7I884_COTGL|nr:hypothetical protein KQX54_008312 [Cotesia glomerata]
MESASIVIKNRLFYQIHLNGYSAFHLIASCRIPVEFMELLDRYFMEECTMHYEHWIRSRGEFQTTTAPDYSSVAWKESKAVLGHTAARLFNKVN